MSEEIEGADVATATVDRVDSAYAYPAPEDMTAGDHALVMYDVVASQTDSVRQSWLTAKVLDRVKPDWELVRAADPKRYTTMASSVAAKLETLVKKGYFKKIDGTSQFRLGEKERPSAEVAAEIFKSRINFECKPPVVKKKLVAVPTVPDYAADGDVLLKKQRLEPKQGSVSTHDDFARTMAGIARELGETAIKFYKS